MVISEKYNFIFIAITKTGTTAIESCFKRMNDSSIRVIDHPPWRKHNKKLWKHMKAREMKLVIPNFDKYFKFTFVRNPWATAVSRYHYEKKQALSRHGPTKFGTINSRARGRNMTFKEFAYLSPGDGSMKYLTDESDNVVIDFIGRVENFQEDFNIICDKIGIPQQQLPHKNKTKHKHYTEYYDDETREIIAKKRKRGIEYFGYEFGD